MPLLLREKEKGKKKTRGLGSVRSAFRGMCGAEGESPTKKKKEKLTHQTKPNEKKRKKLTHTTKKVAVASRGDLRAFAADAF